MSISLIEKGDGDYPERLIHIAQSPYCLYTRGNCSIGDISLAIIGSRRASFYSEKVIQEFMPHFISAGMTIVSGGAEGVDTLAHTQALNLGGHTISVFGSGIDLYYPQKNTRIFDKILRVGGGLISIFPIGTEAEPYNFPIRNEVVAGLSDGVLITEAAIKSGSLITAGLALDQGKEIFCIPGNIHSFSSEGTNALIAKGEAKLIQNAQDIIGEFDKSATSLVKSASCRDKVFATKEENDIYNSIISGYDTADTISHQLSLPVETVLVSLSLLEIDGYVRVNTFGKYIIY